MNDFAFHLAVNEYQFSELIESNLPPKLSGIRAILRTSSAPSAMSIPHEFRRLDITHLPLVAHQQRLLRSAMEVDLPLPISLQEKGIVTCADCHNYLPSVWVCINMLRFLGCNLPIELWHLGSDEMPIELYSLFEELDVHCIDAYANSSTSSHPEHGWELKPYAIINSKFEEVLYLDADNVAVRDPTYLFTEDAYSRTGAAFWPDFERFPASRSIWAICEVPYRSEPEFEAGQILVNRVRCWKPLHLTLHMNVHSEFYYDHIYGDKDTFHMAWRKLEIPYSMPSRPVKALRKTMCQHDFQGRRLFQHRNYDKWTLFPRNDSIRGFLYETECFQYLDQLEEILKKRFPSIYNSFMN